MEVTISTAILLIATIIMATVFTGAALTQLYSFQNSLKQVSSQNQEIFASSITIIGEAQNTTGTPHSIVIWAKNIGQTPFPMIESGSGNASYWDLFITFPDGTYTRFSYNAVAQNGCWNGGILNSVGTAGVWQQGETLEIYAYSTKVPQPGSYSVRLTMPNGVSAQDTFSF